MSEHATPTAPIARKRDAGASSPGEATRAPVRTVDVSAPAVANVHDTLGNAEAMFHGGALGDHAAGATLLGEAGMAVPSTGASAMRQILRETQAEAEGLDTGRAAAHIGARRGEALPEGIRSRLEQTFGHDFSHVRVHTDGAAADAAQALNALAFTLGRDIYFNRGAFQPQSQGGLELLAHELTHVVQADEGRLPAPSGDGLDVSSPSDPHEREAYARGAQVARELGGGAPDVPADPPATMAEAAPAAAAASGTESTGGADLALGASSGTDAGVAGDAPQSEAVGEGVGATVQRAAASTPTGPAASSPTPAAPATTPRITLAGRPVVTDPPGKTSEKSARTSQRVDIPGVTIRTATAATHVGDRVTSGKVTMDIDIGDVIHARGVTSDVDSDGRVVESVNDVTANLPGLGEVKVRVTIGPNGARAHGLIDAAQLRLPGGLVPARGGIAVDIDEKGTVRGEGTVGGTWEGFGDWRLKATTAADGTLSGDMDLALTSRELGAGIKLGNATLRGGLTPDGGRLGGEIPVTVNDILGGTLNGELPIGGTALSGRGQLRQIAPWVLGELSLEQGAFEIRIDTSGATTLEGRAEATHPLVTASLRGTWDAGTERFSGEGPARLRQALPVGSMARIQDLSGKAVVIDNALTELRGKVRAELDLQAQPTLRADVDDARYDVATAKLSGGATLTLTREVIFGANAPVQAVLPQGASVRGTLADNVPTGMQGGFSCAIRDAQGGLATGTLALEVGSEGRTSGTGQVVLDVDYGFPKRDDPSCLIQKGANATLRVVDDAPSALELADAKVTVRNPAGEGRVEGTLAGTIDLLKGSVTGSGTASLVEDWPIPVTWGSLRFTQGGQLELTADENGIDTFHGRVPATAEFAGKQTIVIDGELTGEWSRADGVASGSLSGVLGADVLLAGSTDTLTLKEGALVGGQLDKGAMEFIRVQGATVYARGGEDLLVGAIDEGRYDVAKASVDATASLALAKDVEARTDDGRWTTTLERDSKLTAQVTENELTSLGGQIGVRVADEKGPLAGGTVTDATIDPHTWKAGGNATLTTDRDLPVPPTTDGAIPGTSLKIVATAGSGLAGELVDNALTGVQAQLDIRADDDAGTLGTGSVAGEINLVDGSHEVRGSVELGREVPLSSKATPSAPNRPDGWSATVLPGSSVGVAVKDGVLDRTHADASARIDRGGEAIANAELSGDWTLGDQEKGFDGEARIDLAKRLPWQKGTRFSTDVDVGTSVVATMTQSGITSTRGSFVLTSTLDGKDTVRTATSAEANWTPGGGVTAEGEARLLRDLKVADRGVLPGDATWLTPVTTAKARFENDDLREVGGTLAADVKDKQGEYLHLEGSGGWTWDNGDNVSIEGEASVTRDKAMPAKGTYAPTLLAGQTQAHAAMQDAQVSELSGTVGVRVDKAGAPFAKIAAEGTWGPERGLDGEGRAELLVKELKIAEVSKFSLHLTQGANATARVAQDEVTEIGGQVPLSIREQGAQFLKGELGGRYDLPASQFSGQGAMEVVKDRKLAQAGSEEFWLEKGTGAQVDVKENSIQEIGGNVRLGMRDQKGRYLGVAFEEGKYDLVGGTGFTGKGSAEVVRRKRLSQVGETTFDLDKGVGAKATVQQDHLTEVSGAVPFMVGDAKGDLLAGHVEGRWTAEIGQIDGKGKVSLARDLSWGAVTLLKGSGGEGDVVSSKLQRFKGRMRARVNGADGKPLVELNADGEFDAIQGQIVELVGEATTLRSFEVMTGVEVTQMKGTAHVAANELRSLEGSLKVLAKPTGGRMTARGTIAGGWRKAGDKDLFHGVGELAVDLGKAPRDRGVSGAKLSGTLTEDGTFGIEGQADYKLNQNIGGRLGFSMLHREGAAFDPVLSGSLTAKGNLIDEKLLFSRSVMLAEAPIPIAPPFASINLGARAEVSLKTKPVAMSGTIAIGDWHPVTAATDAPDFDANLNVNWGMAFEAALIPYLEVYAGLPGVVEAGLGVEGRAAVVVNPSLNLGLGLHAHKGNYWGEIAAGVSIAPKLNVSVNPYVYAELLSAFKAKYDFGPYQLASVPLFDWSWQDSYTFGDKPPAASKRPVTTSLKPNATAKAERLDNKKPGGPVGDRAGRAKKEDGPDIDGNDMLGGLGKAESPMDGIRSKLEPVITVFEGLGAVKDLAVLVKDIASALTSPVGLIKFIWKVVTGGISFKQIKQSVDKLMKFLDLLKKWLAGIIPDWMDGVIAFVKRGPPDILDALFGRDEAIGAMVRNPEYLGKIDAQTSREFIAEVRKGYCSGGDERTILLLLENAHRKGFLRSVVPNPSAADDILGSVTGRNDSRARFLFKQNGVSFDGIQRPTDYMHATAAVT